MLARAVCVLAACSLLHAASPWTPEDVARLRTVAEVAISPDGQRIAYALNVPRKLFAEKDGPAWQELHVVDREGRSRPFLAGEVNVSSIAWTPSGERISFLAKRNGDRETALYVLPLAGGEARAAVRRETSIGHYAWSPDGQRLAFTAPRPKSKEQRELEADGFTQEVFEEDQRPDELWIAALDADGLALKPKKIELSGSASAIEWRPDSQRLAVVVTPTPAVDDHYMNRRIVLLDPANGEIHGGYQPPGKMGAFRWSPDGARIAVVSTLDRSDPAAGRVVVSNLRGQDVTTLLAGYPGHVQSLEWTDDGRIAYLAGEGVQTVVASIALNGEDVRTRIGVSDNKVFLAASRAPNGSLALIGESPSHPAEVFLLEKEGSGPPRRLTDSNPWTREKSFAKQETVRFRARDGLLIEGVLIRPLDEQPGKRYPLILYVHGGPEAHESNGWLTSYLEPGQVAAAEGFAVFYPNYRASTGRGVEFSKLDHADPAGREFDDLVDAAEHLASTGLVDPKKVGVTGASYGGYATAWASTALSERFAAGVMFVGISDQVSLAGTTEIPNEMFEVHNRRRPWEDWTLFLERSPIYHAAQSRTPLLILHGKDDPRVPPSQSMELYRALESVGKAPVRLVLYPGEQHGNKRAASRYDYNLRMLRWFKHYLKGPGGDPPPYQSPVAR
ncbi:MAG: S9 family peptidase [Bryobacterales bacterium]|nr:S9 family peptidase [Bryobacterales bacterium]